MEEGVFGEISSASFKASKMSYSFTEKSKIVLSVLRIAIAKYGIPIIINSNQGGAVHLQGLVGRMCQVP